MSAASIASSVVLIGLVVSAGACTSDVARAGSSRLVASQIDALGRVVTARCAPAEPGRTACSGVELGRPAAGAFTPDDLVDGFSGWGALDFASAYDIPTSNPVTAKIAILTAGYNPGLESDLAVYRAQYQLPDCTVASGCLTIVDAHGGSSFAAPRYDDIAESSLEVQVASAGCPSCQLLVVVAGSDPAFTPTLTELASAAGEAVALGATVMVTGYGAPELDENGSPWSASYEKAFSAWPAVPLFAASGDDGFLDGSSPDQSVRVPAAFPEVFAVGGTTLTQVTADVSPRRWTEAALPTASSGCSVVFAKPAGQVDTACAKRTLNDVSASADPALVYFTTVDPASGDEPGWHTEGGTGESAALVASFFAATGIAYGRAPSFVYAAPTYFDDVTGGSNGSCTASPALCNAQAGYDAPTGVGSPYGGAQGDVYFTLSPTSSELMRGSTTGVLISTVGDWAQKCSSLTFGFSGLPAGTTGFFLDETVYKSNPQTTLGITASLTTPLVQADRVTVSATCDGVTHVTTFFIDVVPCVPKTSCYVDNGLIDACGEVSDHCGGTITCPDQCNDGFLCVAGDCVCPGSPDQCPRK